MLKVKDIKKHYGQFQLNCSMEVKEGYITGLIGPNGAGKSTIFKAIMGLINIEDGEIEVNLGEKYKTTIDKKQCIGVSFADSGFSLYINIKKIASIMEASYKKFNKQIFLERCLMAGLPLNKKIKDFSTGMKAKLKILIATSYDAKLLILDEPTAGLDVIGRDDLLDFLRSYMETPGRAILISSHISSDLEGLCDDIYMINDGEIVMHEDTDVLLDKYGILKVTEKQFNQLDKTYLLKVDKQSFGYICLTDQKQFYIENYKDIIIEKCTIDQVVKLMVRGV